MYGLLVYIS